MVGFGMGQYARFFAPLAGPPQVPLPDFAIEHLRATQISYGHNGYLLSSSTLVAGTDFLTDAQRVKEYYTMQSLSAEWAGQDLIEVRYRDGAGGPWLTLNEALLTGGFDFAYPVLHIKWTGGLQIFVNHSTGVVTELGHSIPTHGWAAINPVSGYENLAILDPALGTLVNKVTCTDYEMADGNGVPFNTGGTIGTTTDLTVQNHLHGKTLIETPTGTIVIQ
jgi:hypothetical protein